MKTENSVIPEKYVIENIDLEKNKCDLIMNTDIEEKDNEKTYIYQSYRLTINYFESLVEELETEEGYEKWLKKLIANETSKKAEEERTWRNSELGITDKYMLKDYPNEYPEKTILDYRQALRDYPKTKDFPFGIRPKIEDFE